MASMSSLSPVVSVSCTSNCNYCSFCSDDNLTYVKHVFQAHCPESNFHYICGISDCPHAFKTGATYASFLTHCNHKHSNWREILGRNLYNFKSLPSSIIVQVLKVNPMYKNQWIFNNLIPHMISVLLTVSSEEVELSAARFLLTLKKY